MSACKYCGKDAGWMRSVHKQCQEKHDSGMTEIVDLLSVAAKGIGDNPKKRIEALAAESFIDRDTLRSLTVTAFEHSVSQALSDDIITQDEEDRIARFLEDLDLPRTTLYDNPSYLRLVQAAVLRDIVEGRVPARVNVSGNLPFNFQKSESLVWLFQDVEYLQPRTKTTYQGSTQGVSIRVAKGLYFRTGQFTGNPIVNTQITPIDIGILAATTKHIYIAGDTKSLRARYDKIITFIPYNDGISVQRDSVTRPDIFRTGDGWFIYNLLMNLAQFASS